MSKRVQVLLHQIEDNPSKNTRVDYGEIDSLKTRIKAFGVMGVIRVKENPDSSEGKKYDLDDGFRRVKACKELVSAGIVHADNGDSLEVLEAELIDSELSDIDRSKIQLAVNTSQKRWTPYEQALEIEKLIKAGVSMEEIQEELSLKEMAVKQRLQLLEAPKELTEALKTGSIGFAHARAIQRIPDTDLQVQLTKEAINQDLASRAIEERAMQLTDKAVNELGAKTKRKRKSIPDPTQKIVLRPTQDVISQLDQHQNDLTEVEDKMVKAEMEGYIKALQWVLIDKASLTEEMRQAATAKKASREAKVAEREARKVEREAKKAEREAKKAEKANAREAKKAEREAKKAEKAEKAAEREAKKAEKAEKATEREAKKAATEGTNNKKSDNSSTKAVEISEETPTAA